MKGVNAGSLCWVMMLQIDMRWNIGNNRTDDSGQHSSKSFQYFLGIQAINIIWIYLDTCPEKAGPSSNDVL